VWTGDKEEDHEQGTLPSRIRNRLCLIIMAK